MTRKPTPPGKTPGSRRSASKPVEAVGQTLERALDPLASAIKRAALRRADRQSWAFQEPAAAGVAPASPAKGALPVSPLAVPFRGFRPSTGWSSRPAGPGSTSTTARISWSCASPRGPASPGSSPATASARPRSTGAAGPSPCPRGRAPGPLWSTPAAPIPSPVSPEPTRPGGWPRPSPSASTVASAKS